jgi:hypothetical protein
LGVKEVQVRHDGLHTRPVNYDIKFKSQPVEERPPPRISLRAQQEPGQQRSRRHESCPPPPPLINGDVEKLRIQLNPMTSREYQLD